MSIISKFRNVSEADKSTSVEKLITKSTPDFDFQLFIALSFLITAFGLFINSSAVIIGAMLVAPILYPILSLSMGVVIADFKLIERSFSTMLKSVVIGILISVIMTMFISKESGVITEAMLSRTDPSFLYFLISFVTGLAVCYALIKGTLSEALPGVAVSVTILPPLSVVGIGIGLFNWEILSGALLVTAINIAGVMFAAMLTFSLLDFYTKRNVAENTLTKEEERVEEEDKKAQKIEEETDEEKKEVEDEL